MQAADVPKGDRQQALFEAMHHAYEAHYYDATSMAYREEFIFAPMLEGLDLNDRAVGDVGDVAPVRDVHRVEADLAVCACIGRSPLVVTVLRCAECFAPSSGSQLWDYLQSRVCLRPMGYDAFGLPAEQYAVDTGQHPRVTTEANIAAGPGIDPRAMTRTTMEAHIAATP